MEKHTKVLELMQSKPGGRVELTDPELQSLLGRLVYRVATYMSCIRRLNKLEVRAIRTGRKVVAYELVALADANKPPAPSEDTPAPNPTPASV